MSASQTGAIEFDGRWYTAADLTYVLQDAARGFVRSDDRDLALDPVRWTLAFVRYLCGSALRPDVAAALTQLLMSEEEDEANLCASIVRLVGALDAEVLLRAMIRQSELGREHVVGELAWALAAPAERGSRYDETLRIVLLRVPSSLALIMLAARYDGAWFAEQANAIFAPDVATATVQLNYAEMGAGAGSKTLADIRASLLAARPDLGKIES